MGRLVRYVFIFFIPLLLGALALDGWISQRLSHCYELTDELEVWEDIYQNKIQTDLVIYGSSRAWVQISPKVIEDQLGLSVYNLGMDGSNFQLQYMRHLAYFDHNQPPQTIVLVLDIFSLEKSSEMYKQDQVLPYMLWNEIFANTLKDYQGLDFADFYIPMFRYRGRYDLLPHLMSTPSQRRLRTNGYHGKNKRWNNDLVNAQKAMSNFYIEIDNELVTLLHQFVKEMEAQNIEIVLVYPPEYVGGQSFVKNRSEIIQIYRHYAEQNKTSFLDFSDHPIARQRKYFYNTNHLNKEGAELFTEVLVRRMEEGGVVERQ